MPLPNRIRFFTLHDIAGSLKYTSKEHLAGTTRVFVSFRTDKLPGNTKRASSSKKRDELLKAVGECRSARELLIKYPAVGIPYHSGINAYYHAKDELEERDRVRVFWFYGSAGAGKSYAARHLADTVARIHDPDYDAYRDPVYVANSTIRWFDNYEG